MDNNPSLAYVDILGAPGKVTVDACDALAFMRGVDRVQSLSVCGKLDCRSAPLYIAGERFERLERKPCIHDRVLTAAPLVPDNLWTTASWCFLDEGTCVVDEWYTFARRTMYARAFLVLWWRERAGGEDVTGLAHGDALTKLLEFV